MTNIIPFGKYKIDSAKFYIDKDLFDSVSIPERFILTDADSGELIEEFKKNALSIPYKNHKVYISNVVKTLGNSRQQKFFIEKVMVYFPAKVSDNYFNGITREDFIGVLEFIREKGYVSFTDVNKVFAGVFVKDLDIKIDYQLKDQNREQIDEYYKVLKGRFNGSSDEWHYFKNKRNGFGIQAFSRERSNLKKPFFKFYDKSIEMKNTANAAYYETLSEELKGELRSNFVWRYEITMKNKKYFEHYGITNRLEDLYDVTQEKWKEIGKDYLLKAFDKKRRVIDPDKIVIRDRVEMLFVRYCIDSGLGKMAIYDIYRSAAHNKSEKYKMKMRFEKIWTLATAPNSYTKEMIAIVERVSKWDRLLGLNDIG